MIIYYFQIFKSKLSIYSIMNQESPQKRYFSDSDSDFNSPLKKKIKREIFTDNKEASVKIKKEVNSDDESTSDKEKFKGNHNNLTLICIQIRKEFFHSINVRVTCQ